MHFQSKGALLFKGCCIFPVILCVFLVPSTDCENIKSNDDSSGQRSQKREKRDFFGYPEVRFGTTPVVDPDVVYNGIVDPNNILIHVGQNFINFAAGTLAWFLLSFTSVSYTHLTLPTKA